MVHVAQTCAASGISVGTDCLSADDRKTLRNAALDDGPTATPDPLVYLTTTNDAWTRGRAPAFGSLKCRASMPTANA